ncbi:3-hydroxyacyl-CoA dehydrogenase family protein [Brevibacillus fulvus]|uniref:3-hydroxybutyryl-CoA dehydrogenase n=1 Tax=Brevibacillus fulvus TaxID=1125967 RepID=A0A938XWY0_9BACL|nr:3-hydroxyacyl-CoA dehydrogenase family protein [Brevibacillus fulvus]MBM7589168.1 3-hydroxybutyryl-CoA dehydrogenase [Brevibacillus fulvus]
MKTRTKPRVAVVGTNALAESLREEISRSADAELVLWEELQANPNAPAIELVLETHNLDLKEKRTQLQLIERVIPRDCLILTSVLAVSATEAASWLTHSSRLVGFATFAPVEEKQLVELAGALQTDGFYVERARQFWLAIGKETEQVKDEVGLVFPRILAMIVNEAAFAWTEKTATAADIDRAMRLGVNYPDGPLAWADQIGLDDIYAVLRGLQRELGEERYRPAPLLRKMVHAGWLGKQSGRGFYRYE